MRESAVFYESFYQASIDFGLTTEQKGELFEALCRYAFYGEEIDVSPTIKGIMTLVKPQIDANNKRYSNGKKGGRPSKETDGFDNEKPMVSEEKNQWLKNKKPNVNVDDNDNDNDNDNELKEKEIPNGISKKKNQKHKHGKFKNVLLTDDQYVQLQEKFPLDYDERIEELSFGIEQYGYKYKNHLLAIIQWAKNGRGKNKAKGRDDPTYKPGDYSLDAWQRRQAEHPEDDDIYEVF